MKLTQLHNVRAPAPTDGQALLYEDASGKWVAGNVPSSGEDIGVTVDDTIAAAAANTGTANQVLSWIAKIIKGITGKADWKTAPAITLETLSIHNPRHQSGGPDALTISTLPGSISGSQHGELNDNAVAAHALVTTSLRGFMSNTDKNKLDGINPGATAVQLTASTVGTGGANNDFSRSGHRHGIPSASTFVNYLTGADGAGSGLDADLLDGQQGSFYAPASHDHAFNNLTDSNPSQYAITSSPTDTITGISIIAGAGLSYLSVAMVDILNGSGSDSIFGVKLTFETVFREVSIVAGSRATVTLMGVISPVSNTAVSINITSGAGAGAVVVANKATLQMIRIT